MTQSRPKIAIVGAGSASFGLNTLVHLFQSQHLRGSRLALIDRSPEALQIVARLAERLNREWQREMTIETFTSIDGEHGSASALKGVDFVIQSIEAPPREALWRSDFEIPLRFGVRQPYAENGGPGGFAHTARNLGPVMEVVRAMERDCPQALLINFTNPMARICDAVNRFSTIKVVGLCHQIKAGYAMVGRALAKDLGIESPPEFTGCDASISGNPYRAHVARQAMEKVHIRAAGLNHFTWMISLTDASTGEDLYPLFARRWAEQEAHFEPLTRRVYDAFGLFPIPGDEHLCEYLPWASDPLARPWEKYDISLYEWDLRAEMRVDGHDRMRRLGEGLDPLDSLDEPDSEGAVELIEALVSGIPHQPLAINLPNRGYIPNLPEGAIVEVNGVVQDSEIRGQHFGPLPEGVAELLRREISVTRLSVEAAFRGDHQLALQALLLDPVITDLDVAQQVLTAYLDAYREYLPQFFTKAKMNEDRSLHP